MSRVLLREKNIMF